MARREGKEQQLHRLELASLSPNLRSGKHGEKYTFTSKLFLDVIIQYYMQ